MAVRITVQRITVVINRRRKIFAFEGVGAAATASDIRGKITGAGAVANSQLPPIEVSFARCGGSQWLIHQQFKAKLRRFSGRISLVNMEEIGILGKVRPLTLLPK